MGVEVVELTEVDAHHEAAALLRRVWKVGLGQQLLHAGLLRAFAHTGNYVAGAYLDGELIAVTVGFLAEGGRLHSHITGVAPEHQDHGAGYQLKRHQRDWALARGLTAVGWTFDPLVARNAYFNLHKLGALPTDYLPDFYGPMADGLNAGAATDRLHVAWELEGSRVAAAVAGETPEADAAALRAGGAAVLVDRDGHEPVTIGTPFGGTPVGGAPPGGTPTGGTPTIGTPTGRVALVAVPEDIDTLRGIDPEAAMRWRLAVREALTQALRAGLRVCDATRDGWYVLAGGPAGKG